MEDKLHALTIIFIYGLSFGFVFGNLLPDQQSVKVGIGLGILGLVLYLSSDI